MRVAWKRVQKQIGQPLSRHVFGWRQAWSKDKTLRVDAVRLGLAPKIDRGAGVIGEEPQDAVSHVVQESHPDVERLRPNFEIVVEAGVYKRLFGQSHFYAA